jgi:hypothetical protein
MDTFFFGGERRDSLPLPRYGRLIHLNRGTRNDGKTVNVIAEACFSPIVKIAVTAIQFFLGTNDDDEDSDDEDDVRIRVDENKKKALLHDPFS